MASQSLGWFVGAAGSLLLRGYKSGADVVPLVMFFLLRKGNLFSTAGNQLKEKGGNRNYFYKFKVRSLFKNASIRAPTAPVIAGL